MNLILRWAIGVGGGVVLYWFFVREGASHAFDTEWIIASIISGATISASEIVLTGLVWAIVLWLVAMGLVQHAESIVHRASRSADTLAVSQFAIASIEYVAFVFLWIAVFPDTDRFIPLKLRRACRVVLSVAAVALGLVATYVMIQVLRNASIPAVAQLDWLRQCMCYAMFGLYTFFLLRFLLPATIYRIVGTNLV